MFDYLQAFDPNVPQQNIGKLELIMVQISMNSNKYYNNHWWIQLYYPHNSSQSGLKKYHPIKVQTDVKFCLEPWAYHFYNKIASNRNFANINIETLRQILMHCTRLNNMKTFW